MRTRVPHMTEGELRRMRNGALLVRYLELVSRLERQPDARYLYRLLAPTEKELSLRMFLGLLRPELCGMVHHHLRREGGIHPCNCSDD